MNKGLIISLLFVCVCFSFSLRAQENAESKKLIREKLNENPLKRLFKTNLYMIGKDNGSDGDGTTIDEKALTDEKNISNTKSFKEGELHAVINPRDSNNIVVAFMSNTSSSIGFGIYCTKDFGKTWTKSTITTKPDAMTSVLGGGDPVLAFDSEGKVYFTWISLYYKILSADSIHAKMLWAYSNDGGLTWLREANNNDVIGYAKVSFNLQTFYGRFPDKQWMNISRSLYTANNDLYLCLAEFYTVLNQSYSEISFKVKPANENHFSASKKVSNTEVSCQFSSIDTDNKGNIYISYNAYKDTTLTYDYGIFFTKSTDNGKTFTKPSFVTPIEVPRCSKDQMTSADRSYLKRINLSRNIGNSQLAVDKSNSEYSGNVYLVWNANGIDKKEPNGFDIYFSKSTDGGLNWSMPKVINDDARNMLREQHHPSIYVNNKGKVIIGWYDRRNDRNNIKSDYFVAYSNDGGDNFLQFPITSKPTSFDSSIVGTFHVGEYVQILAVNDYIIPFWIDGRQNDKNLDVYTGLWSTVINGFEEIKPVSEKFSMNKISPSIASDVINVIFSINDNSNITIDIYDLKGSHIGNYFNKHLDKGSYSETFKVSNLSKGKYFVAVTTNFGKASQSFMKN